jgi:hypothetical protein
MNRFLFAIVLIAIAIGGLGFYLGWFNIGSDRSDGKDHITLTLDKEKFKEDEKKAEEKVHDLSHQAKDAAAAPTEKKNKD